MRENLGVSPESIEEITERVTVELARAADRYRDRLGRHQVCVLQARRRKSTGFQERLYSRWADALDLYEMAMHVALECATKFNRRFRPLAAATYDVRFEALSRLHGNAALVASEIYQLLLGGSLVALMHDGGPCMKSRSSCSSLTNADMVPREDESKVFLRVL